MRETSSDVNRRGEVFAVPNFDPEQPKRRMSRRTDVRWTDQRWAICELLRYVCFGMLINRNCPWPGKSSL